MTRTVWSTQKILSVVAPWVLGRLILRLEQSLERNCRIGSRDTGRADRGDGCAGVLEDRLRFASGEVAGPGGAHRDGLRVGEVGRRCRGGRGHAGRRGDGRTAARV